VDANSRSIRVTRKRPHPLLPRERKAVRRVP